MSVHYALKDQAGKVVNVIVFESEDAQAAFAETHAEEYPGISFVKDGDFDPLPAPAEPPAPLVPGMISDVQFFAALAIAGKITESEALDAVSQGAIPAAIATAIASLPADKQFVTLMKIKGLTTFDRHSAIVAELARLLDWSDTQVDDLWRAASAL